MSIESALTALTAPITQSEGSAAPTLATPPLKSLPEVLKAGLKADKPAVEEKAPTSDRFAALARKERMLTQRSREIKSREEEIAKSLKRVSEFDSYKTQGKYVEALQLLGLTQDDLLNFIANGQKPSPELEVRKVQQEIEALKKQQADEKKQAEVARVASIEREYKEASAEFDVEIKDFMKANADKYELINMHEGASIVRATIEQHYKNTKKMMDLGEASDLVESYLEEQIKRSQQAKKFQAKPNGQSEQPSRSSGEKGSSQAPRSASPTLTNTVSSSAPSLLSPRTEQERLTRAMAVLSK